mmetsp:Transcript_48614/g.128536  ORF Transcript_48614/g.128536 Transcript_48614/m.128536 type:complete len:134 (-) Transcript_48614:222-623(-)
MRATFLVAIAIAGISCASAYCNLKTYHSYLKKQELTCGSSKTTYCDNDCKKSVVQWVMYSDGCVAPNENTLPHPFLDDNGINAVYQKDLHEMKVRYKHYCGVAWVGAAGSTQPSLLVSGFFALLTMALMVARA